MGRCKKTDPPCRPSIENKQGRARVKAIAAKIQIKKKSYTDFMFTRKKLTTFVIPIT